MDMACGQFEGLISARLDEPLTSNDERLLNEHLATCAACREFEAALMGQRRMVRGLPSVTMAEATTKPLIADTARPRIWQYQLAIPLPVAALLALVMGIGWWLALRPSDDSAVPSPGSERLARSVEVVRVQPAVARPVEADLMDSLTQKGDRPL
jgi:anti-sigma factor RsiW